MPEPDPERSYHVGMHILWKIKLGCSYYLGEEIL